VAIEKIDLARLRNIDFEPADVGSALMIARSKIDAEQIAFEKLGNRQSACEDIHGSCPSDLNIRPSLRQPIIPDLRSI
jgi:hypothetical protein